MLGLGYLGAFSYCLKKREGRLYLYGTLLGARSDESLNPLRLLRRRGKDLGRYLESQPYPAFMIDTNHTIVHWNSALERLTGFKAAGDGRHPEPVETVLRQGALVAFRSRAGRQGQGYQATLRPSAPA